MLEEYFSKFQINTIGHDLISKQSRLPILYADWTASGRLYRPIEDFLTNEIGPYVANPHTENTETGQVITAAYKDARQVIKQHVNANENDALICTGSGATAAINKLQRLIGLKPKQEGDKTKTNKNFRKRLFQNIFNSFNANSNNDKPVVFVSHMEHHSNQTSWNTCDVDVEVIDRAPDGQPCIKHLNKKLAEYKNRTIKIGAFTACSNVTGIKTDVHLLAKTMHLGGGNCFIDYACSAPYVDINMHPQDPLEQLDGIYFSPHKFLGGPGTCGVLIFNKSLYKKHGMAPDKPGGGTVLWTNPWGEQAFYSDIEKREDGGTPPFMQTIKTALAIKLKDEMGVNNIEQREKHLRQILLNGFDAIPSLKILEPNLRERLCIVSFYIEDIHHNLIVRLLNDKFGIQARGGCSCAGTYGHILLNVDKQQSNRIVEQVNGGDLSNKPGWIRVSLHPTNKDADAYYIVESLEKIVKYVDTWKQDYIFDSRLGDFKPAKVRTSNSCFETFLESA